MRRLVANATTRFNGRNAPLVFAAALCLLVSAALPFGLGALLRNEQAASRGVAHTLKVLNTAAAIETDIANFTSEARGYFVDRNDRLVGLFDNAVRRVADGMSVLRALTADNPLQQETLGRLEPLIATRVAALRGAIAGKRAGDGLAGPTLGSSANGKPLIDRIVEQLEAVKSEERRLLAERARAADAAAARTVLGIGAGGAFAAAAGLAAVWLLFARQRRRERLSIVQRLNADLERRVGERTCELAASEARQKAYFNHLADGLVVVRVEPDDRLFIQEANAAAREMLGYPEDFAGRSFHDFWPEEFARELIAKLLGCVRARNPIRYDTSAPTPAGRREFRSVVAPVFGPPEAGFPDGRVVLLLASVRDVTRDALIETQLREAQRMEAVGRLSAGMAHDFNNLLQAQMGSLELLEDAIDAGRAQAAREHVATALRLGERGAVLTHHLLSFSRKQVMRPCPVDPARALPATAAMLASTLGPDIRITVEIDPSTGSVLADPNLLETALLNLAFNARDAMPKGGQLRLQAYAAAPDSAPDITPPDVAALGIAAHDIAVPGIAAPEIAAPDAAASDAAGAGRFVVFAVSDEGTGMSPETLERAMEPFFTTKSATGSGLGLAMVQGFALQSGGNVRIRSELGRGTRIEVWLPASGTGETASGVGPIAPVAPSGGRALVVDDVADVLVTVSAFLGAAGFEVTQAATGEAALDILCSGRRFDLLVSDYTMPGMTGAELVERALDVSPGLAVLIVTGNAEALVARHLPNVRVLSKPFRRDELLLAAGEVMQTQGAARQPVAARS